nr:helix-turn-helix domain-containing protein [uncultured Chitinophaga sp.]
MSRIKQAEAYPANATEVCKKSLNAIRDAMYVMGGKWKLPIIIALLEGGPQRFKELQRSVQGITPKVLSKELKELELNEFVTRTVYDSMPVAVEYKATTYSRSLDKVILEMKEWGEQHRKRIMSKNKLKKA